MHQSQVQPIQSNESATRFEADNWAASYARRLLQQLGYENPRLPSAERIHPARRAANCGLMALTGQAAGAPQLCPAPVASCADGVMLALRALAPGHIALHALQGAQLLTERAGILGLSRNGSTAPGGSCRLLAASDGRLAVNLARDEDWRMLPAWLQCDAVGGAPESWQSLEAVVATRLLDELLARGRLMGLAVAPQSYPQETHHWFDVITSGPRVKADLRARPPLVVDLSSLWAGPLCGHLLQLLGARVIKVESVGRADGARAGNRDFYELLNQGKECLSLDLNSHAGRLQLQQLLTYADIVIESARPRGLQQMGIVAEDWVARQPGLTWISITAYGRCGEAADWVGFGDDVAVAAGLSGLMAILNNESMFVGDAPADPLTGLHAALAAWHGYSTGGGKLISLALRDVTAHCAGFGLPDGIDAIRNRHQAWSQLIDHRDIQLPQPRRSARTARPPGADNTVLFNEFNL